VDSLIHALAENQIDAALVQTLRDVVIAENPDIADEPILKVEQEFPILTLKTPGTEAWSLWERLHSALPAIGFYPVMMGTIGDLSRQWESLECAEMPATYLAHAAACSADTWLAQSLSAGASRWIKEGLNRGWNDKTEPQNSNAQRHSAAQGEEQYIALLKTPHSWQTPAYIGFGGWNDCPLPDIHVCVQRQWYERYGVEIVALGWDSMLCRVQKPISTRDEALVVARAHAVYCSDVMNFGYDEVAARLLNAGYWDFWWD